MDPRLIDFVGAINRTGSFEEAWARTVAFFRDQGQAALCYSYSYVDRVRDTHNGVIHEFTRFAPYRADQWPDLHERYMAEQLYDVDRSVQHSFVGLQPMVWGLEYMQREEPRLVRHYAQVQDIAGVTASVCIPMRQSGDREWVGMLHFGGAFRRPEFDRLLADRGNLLWLAALNADAAMARHLKMDRALSVRLSPREKECLEWLSRGFKNDRIAEHMGITGATVELHLANARRKLKASTREQALAQALLLGIVRP